MRNSKTMTALHLTVNNHPGVMSHICGLFARRAFNVEGILVAPVQDGATASVWLLVNEDERIEQVVRQVSKLHDVLDVRTSAIDSSVLDRLSSYLFTII